MKKTWTIDDLKREYEISLESAITQIQDNHAKVIILQFPDGLKQYATAISDYLKEKTGALFLIYLGSCFGACDTPQGFENFADLTIQFGHNSLMPSYLK